MSLTREEIELLAFYDYLTGIPNRNYIKDKLPQMLKEVKEFAALIYIDVDNFTEINDTLGYDVGDQLLVSITSTLKKSLKSQDMLFSFGIDKFIIFEKESNNELEVASFVYELLNKLNTSFKISGYDIFVTVTIGVSIYPKDAKDYKTLIKNADIAMNYAKKMDKSNYKFFEKSLEEEIQEKVKLQQELRQAVENNELQVFYQPKIDVNTGEIDGMEALVRWKHSEKGYIPPSKFIPLAEQTGIITEIGQFVLKTACVQNKTWQQLGYKPVKVAVNLSMRQLKGNSFINFIRKVLKETQLDPKWLEFEITESMVMENFQQTEKLLKKITDLGIDISLDDFGTGYSSLNYLKSLPIDCIKIDKSFIDEILTDKKQNFISSALINLAHGINLKVIAEGVETIEQFKMLKKYDCDTIQGYFFSKPVPDEEFEDMLRHNKKYIV
jgi:diguanylate cyclase (GGDEF)-like protein